MWAKPSVTPRCYQVTTAAMPGLPRDTQTHSWGRHQGTEHEPQPEGIGYRGFSAACQVCARGTKYVGEWAHMSSEQCCFPTFTYLSVNLSLYTCLACFFLSHGSLPRDETNDEKW